MFFLATVQRSSLRSKAYEWRVWGRKQAHQMAPRHHSDLSRSAPVYRLTSALLSFIRSVTVDLAKVFWWSRNPSVGFTSFLLVQHSAAEFLSLLRWPPERNMPRAITSPVVCLCWCCLLITNCLAQYHRQVTKCVSKPESTLTGVRSHFSFFFYCPISAKVQVHQEWPGSVPCTCKAVSQSTAKGYAGPGRAE